MFPMMFPFQRRQTFLMNLPFHPLVIQGVTFLVIAVVFFFAIRYLIDKIPLPSDEIERDHADADSPFGTLK